MEGISDLDRRIMAMRGLGWSQKEMSKELSISQSAISQRIEKIRNLSKKMSFADHIGVIILFGIENVLEAVS